MLERAWGFESLRPHPSHRFGRPLTVWFNGRVNTEVEQLDGDRVRLSVEVPAARRAPRRRPRSARSRRALKIPGFRKGKVPMPVLVSRIGKRAALRRGGREPHRQLVLERRGRRAHPPRRAARVRLRAARRRATTTGASPPTFAVQPRPELPDWTSSRCPRRARGARGGRRGELEALQRIGRRAVAGRRPRRRRRATRSWSTSSSDGEAQRDYVVELGANGWSTRSRRRSAACPSARRRGQLRARRRLDQRRRR